jgi:hypothetical protein
VLLSWALALPRTGRVPFDATVSGLDELDSSSSVFPICVDIVRHRGSLEVIERRKDCHGGAVVSNEILQQDEVRVPREALEQREEVAVPANASPSGLDWPA